MIILVLLCFLSLFVSLLFSKVIVKGSDNYYHKLLINLIRNNNNRFITKHDNFINENLNSYPQLLHWLFSLFSDEFVQKFSRFLSPFFQILINLSFLGFILMLEYFNVILVSYNLKVLGVLLFQLIPYNFNVANAKNSGLSARGLGLFLGQNLVFTIVLYIVSGSYIYLGVSGLTVMLIFLSSQFATQFALLFSIISSILLTDVALMLPFIIGITGMLVFFNKYTKVLIKGQLNHKIVYSQFLAERFILKQRPSVWLDIFIELPKEIYYVITRQVSKERFGFVDYMLNSSIVIFIFEMPFLFSIMVNSSNFENEILGELFFLVLSAVIIFLATTFRKFRFLGEPERYLEFVLPVLIIVLISTLPPITICFIFIYNLIFVLVYFLYKKKTFKIDNTVDENVKEVNFVMSEYGHEKGFSVITNNSETGKYFFDVNIKMYFYLVNMRSVDGLKFQDVFTEFYPLIRADSFAVLVKKYRVPYVFLKNLDKDKYLSELQKSELKMELLVDGENNSLYRVNEYLIA